MMTILILNSYNMTTYLSLKNTYWEYLNYLKIKSVENITPYVIVNKRNNVIFQKCALFIFLFFLFRYFNILSMHKIYSECYAYILILFIYII